MTAQKRKIRKWRKYAVLFGILLAIACKSLPARYQGPCEHLARICTGNLLP